MKLRSVLPLIALAALATLWIPSLTASSPVAPAAAPETAAAAVSSAGLIAGSGPEPASGTVSQGAACNSNQCYLACVRKGYFAGYCIGGTCVCQSSP